MTTRQTAESLYKVSFLRCTFVLLANTLLRGTVVDSRLSDNKDRHRTTFELSCKATETDSNVLDGSALYSHFQVKYVEIHQGKVGGQMHNYCPVSNS